MIHSIIVGFGLAGLNYVEQLLRKKKQFYIVDLKRDNASTIASGIYNATVLKRYTLTWKGDEFIDYAFPFYEEISKRLGVDFIKKMPIYKVFNESKEHNLWVRASDKIKLERFLDSTIYHENNPSLKTPLGYGKVLDSGKIDTNLLLSQYRESLDENWVSNSAFDFDSLEVTPKEVKYKNIVAKNIVFCEGFGMKKNPFFNALPLVGLKGQILIIKSEELQIDVMLKGSIYIVPLGDNLYWVGATFDFEDRSLSLTEKGREWLEEKLQRMINCSYEVVNQVTQIRPTVVDRRPLVGTHKVNKNVHLLNGLGTRGVISAPMLSEMLYEKIENKRKLSEEIDINRFEKG